MDIFDDDIRWYKLCSSMSFWRRQWKRREHFLQQLIATLINTMFNKKNTLRILTNFEKERHDIMHLVIKIIARLNESKSKHVRP